MVRRFWLEVMAWFFNGWAFVFWFLTGRPQDVIGALTIAIAKVASSDGKCAACTIAQFQAMVPHAGRLGPEMAEEGDEHAPE